MTAQADDFDLALFTRLRAWAHTQPDAPCVIEAETGLTLSYGAFFAATLALRRRLGPTPRVIALQAPGGALAAITWIAALTGGHTLIPLPTTAPMPEIVALLKRMPPDALMLDDTTDAGAAHLTWKAAQQVCAPERIAGRDFGPRLCDQGAPLDAEQAPAPHPGKLYLSTSGSTGEPKGVLLDARQVAWTADQVRLNHELTPHDRGLTPLPFFHINAPVVSLAASLLTGGSVVIAPQFRRGAFWAQIERHQVTWASLVPTIVALLLDMPEPAAAPASLRFVRTASAPLPAAHMRAFEHRFGVPVVETYGLTEAASQICANPAPPRQRKPGSVGLPVGIALRVVRPAEGDDTTLHDVAPGEVGEVCVQGPSIIAAYVEGRGASAFRDGWFRTGDLGYQDADGYLFLTGRLRDVINHGGENVSPREVEETLLAHPAVTEAAVIGAPDRIYGEQVIACVTLRAPWTVALNDSLRALCAERLAKYKRPTLIIPMPEMPRTKAGKLDRPALRAQWAQQREPRPAAPGLARAATQRLSTVARATTK
jgi:acyl-CoA synthetase (AMP-forming)/AMP-acid ligase II